MAEADGRHEHRFVERRPGKLDCACGLRMPVDAYLAMLDEQDARRARRERPRPWRRHRLV